MINLFYKYRILIQLFGSLFFIIFIFNSVSNSADLIKPVDISNNVDVSDVRTIEVNIPQGSSASQISSILDSTGVVTSSFAFDLYLRN